MDTITCKNFFEALSRVRLGFWLMSGIVGFLALIISGWWAHAFGFPWQLIALTAFGGLTASILVMGGLIWLSAWILRRMRASAILKKLDADARYLMAIEGVALKRMCFGPFPYGDGEYGYMSWDRVRIVALNRFRNFRGIITTNHKRAIQVDAIGDSAFKKNS